MYLNVLNLIINQGQHSMDTLCLTYKETIEITGRERFSAQVRCLRSQGFTVIERADGYPIVSRSHFESLMGGLHHSSKPQDYQPDFSSFHGTQTA